MAILTVTPMTFGTRTAGAIPTYAGTARISQTPSAGGDSFVNDGKTFILLYLPTGSALTVTATCVRANNQGVTENLVCSVPSSSTMLFGLFSAGEFNDANGMVNLTYSSVTNLKIDVFSMSRKNGRG